MIVAGCDVRDQRAQRVERGLVAPLLLLLDVHLKLVHRHVARPFDHHLAAALPGPRGQLAHSAQLGELRLVGGVGQTAGAESVTQRERYVVAAEDVAYVIEAFVQRVLPVVVEHPLSEQGAAT